MSVQGYGWRAIGPPLWGFAVATAYWPGILSSAIVPRWAVILLGLGLVSEWNWRACARPVLALMALGTAYAAISLLWTPDKITGAADLLWLIALMGVAIAAADWERIDGIMLGLAAGAGVSAAICIPQLLGWRGIYETASPSGLFFNRDILAEFAAPICVWLLLTRRLALALVLAFVLAVCQSRVALLAVACGLAWAWWQGRWSRALVAAALMGALGLAAIFLVSPDKFFSGASRINVWHIAATMLSWRGLGLGFFHSAVPFGQLIHSDLLQMAAELGVGVLLFAAIPIVLAWRGWVNGCLWSPAWAVFAAAGLETVISFPLRLPASAFVAAVLAGHLARSWDAVSRVRSDGRDAATAGILQGSRADNGMAGYGGSRLAA